MTLILLKRFMIINLLWFDIVLLEYLNNILPLLYKNKKAIEIF